MSGVTESEGQTEYLLYNVTDVVNSQTKGVETSCILLYDWVPQQATLCYYCNYGIIIDVSRQTMGAVLLQCSIYSSHAPVNYVYVYHTTVLLISVI